MCPSPWCGSLVKQGGNTCDREGEDCIYGNVIGACPSPTGDRRAFDQHFHRVLGAEDIIGPCPVLVEPHEFECRYVLWESHVKMVLVQYVNQELGILQYSGGEELTIPFLVPARVVSVEVPCPDEVVVMWLWEGGNVVPQFRDCSVYADQCSGVFLIVVDVDY